ncbi:MAG: cell division protein CrgA [Acidimicrobiia bacterium]
MAPGPRRTPRPSGRTTDPGTSSRYTPPVPAVQKVSPRWVPVVMFALLGLGALVILLFYLGFVPGGRNNWWLFGGLVGVLGGLFTATKYH